MCVESFTWERSEDPLTHCLLAKAWNESSRPSGNLQRQIRIPEETREVPLERNRDLSHQMLAQTGKGELAAPRSSGCGHGRRPREAEIISEMHILLPAEMIQISPRETEARPAAVWCSSFTSRRF